MSVIDVEVVLGLTEIDVSVDAEGSKVDVVVLKDFTASGGMSKAVYDPNNNEADAFDMDNMVEGADTKILTAAERSAIATSGDMLKSVYDPNDDGKIANAQLDDMPVGSIKGYKATNLLPGSPEDLTPTELRALINVNEGAEPNPDLISQAEAEAGTATDERIFTAERVK